LMTSNNAIIQVDSYASLDKEITALLEDESRRSCLQKNTGALTHNAEEILERYTTLII
jgi:hypothetical protein